MYFITKEIEMIFLLLSTLRGAFHNYGDFLRNLADPILYFLKEDEYIFYRKSYLQEIVEKDGYKFEDTSEEKMYTISATLPNLERDEYGKVLIKKD